MTATIITTNTAAAVCALTVSQSLYENDLLLQLVSKLASPLQLRVAIIDNDKNKKQATAVDANSSSTAYRSSDLVLTMVDTSLKPLIQRNTILYTLVGYGLLFALDQAPYYLCGGYTLQALHSKSTCVNTRLSQMKNIMIEAETIVLEGGTTVRDSTVLQKWNTHLQRHAFLVQGTSQPTLADMDMALTLMKTLSTTESPNSSIETYQHLSRWLNTVTSVMHIYGQKVNVTIPLYSNSLSKVYQQQLLSRSPMFFYGHPDDPPIGSSSLSWSPTKQSISTPSTVTVETSKDASNKETAQAGISTTTASTSNSTLMKSYAKEQNAPNNKEKKEKKVKDTTNSTAFTTAVATNNSNNTPPTEYDVSALDIRVGKIIKVWPHESSDKLFCEEIDIGKGENNEMRQIASGLRAYYQVEELQNRLVVVLCNLKAKPLGGFVSHGMVLCASNTDHTQVQLIEPPMGSVLGERVFFKGLYDSSINDTASQQQQQPPPEPENKMSKKKIFEKVAPFLQTNNQGHVHWKGNVAYTSAGIVVSQDKMPNAQVA